jgi:hypothetical protein
LGVEDENESAHERVCVCVWLCEKEKETERLTWNGRLGHGVENELSGSAYLLIKTTSNSKTCRSYGQAAAHLTCVQPPVKGSEGVHGPIQGSHRVPGFQVKVPQCNAPGLFPTAHHVRKASPMVFSKVSTRQGLREQENAIFKCQIAKAFVALES